MSNHPPVSQLSQKPPEQLTLSDYHQEPSSAEPKSLLPVAHDAEDVDWYLPTGRTPDIEWFIQALNQTFDRIFKDFETVKPSAAKAALSVYHTEATRHLAPAGTGPSPNAAQRFLTQMQRSTYSESINTVIQLLNSVTQDALDTRMMDIQEIREGIDSFVTAIDFYATESPSA